MRIAAVLAVTIVLGACDRATSRDIAAPDGAASLNEVPDGGIGTSIEGPFDAVIASEDPSAQQAATGGRASGHVGFTTTFLSIANEKYSFVALSTAPPPPLNAKGQYELMLETVTGTTNKVHGEVICLSIVGNRARIGGRINKAWVNNVPFPTTLFNVWTVVDNGEGEGTADEATLMFFTSEQSARSHCATGFNLPQRPIDEGNVQVSSK